MKKLLYTLLVVSILVDYSTATPTFFLHISHEFSVLLQYENATTYFILLAGKQITEEELKQVKST